MTMKRGRSSPPPSRARSHGHLHPPPPSCPPTPPSARRPSPSTPPRPPAAPTIGAPPPPSSWMMLPLIDDDDSNSHSISFSDDNGDSANVVATAKENAAIMVEEEFLDVKVDFQESFVHHTNPIGRCSLFLETTKEREHEGRSDFEEDDARSSEYSDSFDSEKASPGPSGDYSGDEYEDEAKDGIVHDNWINGDEVDLQSSDSDLESDSDLDNVTTMKDESKCSYLKHLERVLTNAEVHGLQKRIWKYTWEMPAFGSSTSKWKGTGECPFKLDEIDSFSGLKLKLYKNWLEFHAKSGGSDFHCSRQWHFYSLCSSYRDLLYGDKKPFYLKGDVDLSVMDAYILHTLNHIYRARTLVIKNANKLAKNPDRNEIEVLNGGCFLDRGFTRPKVLLLLPFRGIALRVVKRLIQLTPLPHKNNVQGIDRFCNEFGTVGGDDDDEIDMARKKTTKPADFQVLFGGNINEAFMIGIKFTKGSIKLYSDFYSSDIIVASPVQLVHAIGKAEVEKDKDVDYLSSIEILIMDHADIIAMQNWSHVNSIFEHLNTIPSDPHGTDIMRVRPWYLDGHACFYRQTILLGSYLNPDMNALFNHHCANYKGKVKFVGDHKGVIPKVLLPVRQVFERFSARCITEADDARFDYFVKKVFTKISDSFQGGILLFISNYLDFVRVRNFLKSQSASFCLLGEYTKQSDISRARVWFFNGERKIMLYTERAHFYHRYTIRGIKKLIIYSLPERREFYPEVVNMLDDAQSMCTVLFSRFDHLQLERIVGTTASKKMQLSDKDMFVFC